MDRKINMTYKCPPLSLHFAWILKKKMGLKTLSMISKSVIFLHTWVTIKIMQKWSGFVFFVIHFFCAPEEVDTPLSFIKMQIKPSSSPFQRKKISVTNCAKNGGPLLAYIFHHYYFSCTWLPKTHFECKLQGNAMQKIGPFFWGGSRQVCSFFSRLKAEILNKRWWFQTFCLWLLLASLALVSSPAQAVLSGTGGVYKSPEAQAYFARRWDYIHRNHEYKKTVWSFFK